MKKVLFLLSMTLVICSLTVTSGCKTADEEVVEDFAIESASGYSLKATVIPKDQNQDDYTLTSIHLYAAVRNKLDIPGTVISWKFMIKRDIVTILEINQNNYQNYKLAISGVLTIPADDIKELYVGTPQPFMQNALHENIFTFKPYVPTDVVVEIQIQDESGTIHNITGSGGYTYEETTINES